MFVPLAIATVVNILTKKLLANIVEFSRKLVVQAYFFKSVVFFDGQ